MEPEPVRNISDIEVYHEQTQNFVLFFLM